MPIQIDRMDTTIELTSPSTPPRPAAPPAANPVDDPLRRGALREAVLGVLADELERYMSIRGTET